MGYFPLDVKCVLVSQMNRYLLTPSDEPAKLLTSQSHVLFVMELVGQGFNLPLTQIGIIQHSVNVYSNWLLEPLKRPAAIVTDGEESNTFQEFIQVSAVD